MTSAGAGGQAFTFTEHDLDLGVLSSSYEGSTSPKKVGKIDLEDPPCLSLSGPCWVLRVVVLVSYPGVP